MNHLQRTINDLNRQLRQEKDPDRKSDLQERLAIAIRQLEESKITKDRTLLIEQEGNWFTRFLKWGK